MQLVVLADTELKEELLCGGQARETDIVWIDSVDAFLKYKEADGFIDLLFEADRARIELLKNISAGPVIINSVITTVGEMGADFIRINAWPTFLKRAVVEASSMTANSHQQVELIFNCFNKKTQWVDDIAGFITPRVIAAIINEAWFALEEGVSSKDEIDIAMKLGTNYPYGPFEWSDKIGPGKIYYLLKKLSEENLRYEPAPGWKMK